MPPIPTVLAQMIATIPKSGALRIVGIVSTSVILSWDCSEPSPFTLMAKVRTDR
ncbi:MAG: hypothetical protein JWP89_5203 [Schlesneria sp.]|nr:hypothetical protein [Schlesneria sp.]